MRPLNIAITTICLLVLIAIYPSSALSQPGKGGPPPALVELGNVIERVVDTKITFPGTAEAHRMVTLASQVEGVVLRGEVEEGDRVKKGQVLVLLDGEKIQLKAAEAQAQLKEALAVLEQQKRDLKRKQTLHRTKSVPLKDLEDARTGVERQQAFVGRTKATLELLQSDLADTQISAPRAGVVVKRLAYVGEWVKKGGAVLTFAVLDPLKVVIQVPERYVANLELNNQVVLMADSLSGEKFPGKITAIIPSGDVKSRTFPVQIRVQNPEARVKPGMLVRATLSVGQPHKALLVPKEAVVISQRGYSVITVKDGKAMPVSVELVAGHNGMQEIKGPLKPGQSIVTTGNERLFPGQPVRVAGSKARSKTGPPGAQKQNKK
jgi:RND family efflux transporter MFP subunit